MNKKYRYWIALLLTLAMALSLAACGQKNEGPDAGQTLTVGIRNHVEGSTLAEADGTLQGYEVDMIQAIAAHIYGEGTAVEFIYVSDADRTAVLDDGTADVVMASYTITPERQQLYQLSQSYYTCYVGILVRADSNLRTLADMDGRTLGVIAGTTTQAAVEEAAAAVGVSPRFAEYGDYDSMMAALMDGSIDGFPNDLTALASYFNSDTWLLPERFAPQEYGIVMAKDNTELAAAIDAALDALTADGTVDSLQAKWGVTPLGNYSSAAIGVLAGAITEELLLACLPEAEIHEYATLEDALAALAAGEIAALASDQSVLNSLIDKNEGYVMLNEPITSDSYALAVARDNAELAAAVNDVLATESLYNEMIDRWFPASGSPGPLPAIENSGANGTLTLAAFTGAEPFSYKEGETVTGFEIELAARAAAALGKTLVIKEAAITELLPAVIDGEADLCCGCLTVTPERSEQVLFCDDEYFGGIYLLIKQS